MSYKYRIIDIKSLAISLILTVSLAFAVIFLFLKDSNAASNDRKQYKNCQMLIADRVFDGFNLHENAAVIYKNNRVIEIGPRSQLSKKCKKRKQLDLGDATIFPGFIESHAHTSFQNVSNETLLKHGVTTVRDTGGPLHQPMGGNGKLRLLSSGPIIQAPDGYPLNIFGHGHSDAGHHGKYGGIGLSVATIAEAELAVEELVSGGAAIIKIALEPGGEEGAPWMASHGHGEIPSVPWPLLPLDIVKAIVNKAHALDKRVLAHLGEDTGVEMALDAGVDE